MVDKQIGEAENVLGCSVIALGKGARGFNEEFMEFLLKYQVIGLAVAVVIGTAATKLVLQDSVLSHVEKNLDDLFRFF